jgi:pumilio homology domain family member 6
MPTAIATKNTMNGTKRKGAPSKDAHTKDSKKPKIDSNNKKATMKPKVQQKTARKIEEQSDSEDFDSEGGAPLYNQDLSNSSGLEESDTTEFSEEGKVTPAAKDGVHPDRVNAAVQTSKSSLILYIYSAYTCQVNRQKRHMQSKSN